MGYGVRWYTGTGFYQTNPISVGASDGDPGEAGTHEHDNRLALANRAIPTTMSDWPRFAPVR
ncbi:hypothetical protein FRUB_07646 [Fimbriiglobus ruber]|uniref:Uncharacterized protein n=1 Tax=Fimbriiglobus ruber TaxID=1908690 RepID=A0A225DM20_9BACT|nr:hypothetical protein FRUB_07646 [Fimbriiglobus ruber]